MKIPNIEEARAILGEEFDQVPDKTIELMIHTFHLIAGILIKNRNKER